ncbi:hypothetical protein MMC29_003682 [Sticta canariensis]|nr:hypothetical protein [Sticta canariensis]
MIIFKDILNGDELLSDSYEIREVNDAVYEVDCEMVKPTDLNSINIGANPSAEDAEDEINDNVKEVINLVHGCNLVYLGHEETRTRAFGSRKDYFSELKAYLAKVQEILEKDGADPAKIETFKTGVGNYWKSNIKDKFQDFEFYKGPNESVLGMIVLLNYREKLDKKTGNMVEIPYMILWKHGLREEAF